jgi:DMSO reductase anchor subunit
LHPAFSVIFFTTASGAGFGLLALLGVLAPAGILPPDRVFGLVALALAFGAAATGLVASTFHLGRPERAWRAFSQWRTSWLSREGVASVATFVPAGLFAIGWVFAGSPGGLWGVFGVLAAVGAIASIYCTAMIYRSLKTIQRWCNGWVAPNYFALALMTGALWLDFLLAVFGALGPGMVWLSALVVLLAAALKLGYWRYIDRTRSLSTAESATGLGAFGRVRLFEAPHTEENYLLKEMGYRVARKHAAKLRLIALALAFVVPLALTLALLALPGRAAVIAALLAAASASAGVLVERWLFFAEAKHTVTLYYGAATA